MNRWTLWGGRAIGVVALLTSAVTAYLFVREAGGDVMHAVATPFCLEAFALVALARGRLWIFAAPFVTAVVINVAHGVNQGSLVLAGVYALPPLAAVGVTHVLLGRRETLTSPVPDVTAAPTPDPAPKPVEPQEPVRVSSNGRFAKIRLPELEQMVDADVVAEADAATDTRVDAAAWLSALISREVSVHQWDRLRSRVEK